MILFLKIAVFSILVPGTVAGYIPWSIVRDIPLVITPWVNPSALCFVVGVAIYLWCAYDFGVAGRGTPAQSTRQDSSSFVVFIGMCEIRCT